MGETEEQKSRWDNVYGKEPGLLPWFGIDFPKEVTEYLIDLNKKERIYITGCGCGDVVKRVSLMGFEDVIGTDISEKAIEISKKRFPDLHFKAIATELLPAQDCSNALDWLNLHQIENIKDYLFALGKISKKLCLVWIGGEKNTKAKSYVHEGFVYFHDPSEVEVVLREVGLVLIKQFVFNFTTNPSAGSIRTHGAIGQIYEK